MITKSVRLTEEEAADLRKYVSLTGELEANVLKRAALRGFKDLRFDQAILRYMENGDSYEAAEIAGMGRAEFLWLAMERGVPLLKGPSYMEEELESLGRDLGDERLVTAARKLAEAKAADRKLVEAGD
jgi:predicted HTH domain antitoxin